MVPAPRVSLQEAYLLHRRNYRETSLLLDFFTRSHGRITLLGKGIRRRKYHHAAVVWPFVPLAIAWSGRGELPVMTKAENLGPGGLSNPQHLACALYLNELMVHLLAPGDPHPCIFDLYHCTLQQLVVEREPAGLLRHFELRFLEEIGYALVLDREIENGAPIQPDRCYRYLPEHGPIESEAVIDSIRGSTLLAMQRRELDCPAALNEAKRLTRRMISHLLGERRLHSRELFKYSSHQ